MGRHTKAVAPEDFLPRTQSGTPFNPASTFAIAAGGKHYYAQGSHAKNAMAGFTTQTPGRFAAAYQCPTWGGRPISRWTRYGYWDETGVYFTPTRVI